MHLFDKEARITPHFEKKSVSIQSIIEALHNLLVSSGSESVEIS